jgi:hypothetical protein
MCTKTKNRLTQTPKFDKMSLMTLYQTFMSACLQYVVRESTKTVDIISKHDKHGDLDDIMKTEWTLSASTLFFIMI